MTKKIIILCTLLLSALGLAACVQSASASTPPLQEPVAAFADISVVDRGDIMDLHILPGIVRAQTHPVRLEAGSGQIVAIYAYHGESVTEGQVIAKIDVSAIEELIQARSDSINRFQTLHQLRIRDMTLEIEILELNYLAADSNSDDARRIRERIEWLRLDLNHIQRRHNRDLEEAQADLRELAERLELYLYHSEIKAPIDGIVVHINASVGGWLADGDIVMYIACHNDVVVELTVNSSFIPQISDVIKIQGQRHTSVDLFNLAHLPLTRDEQIFFHTLRSSLPIRFEILEESNEIPSVGEAVFVHLYTTFAENVLRIPFNALMRDILHGDFVYRIEDGAMVIVSVVVGTITTSYVEILEGLYEGDEIFVNP